jgi:hypothetical protein
MRTRLVTALILAGSLLPAYSAHGQSPLAEVSPEAVVNTFTMGNQTAPAVAASASGTVWIAWLDTGSQIPAIKARRYAPSGAPLSPEIAVQPSLGFFAGAAGPRIAAMADGGCVVVWSESPSVWYRRFDRNGAPLGGQQQIVPSGSFETISFPDVAVAADGSFLVAWLQSDLLNDAVRAQRFDPQGQSLGAPSTIDTEARSALASVRVAGAADGGFLAVWSTANGGEIFARRYDASGAGSPVRQVSVLGSYSLQPAAALASDGSARVVWIFGDKVWARRLNAAGEPEGPAVKVVEGSAGFTSPAVTVDRDGIAVVVGSDSNANLQARLLKDDLTPLSGEFPVSDPAFPATDPVLATTASGGVVLAWSSGYFINNLPFPIPIPNPPITPGRDGDGLGVVTRIFAPLRCAAGSKVLCLGPGGRFEASVAWKNPNSGETGAGHSLPLTADTGSFWFFGESNLELMVKVLDGTSINGHFWVYGGALSNVEYTLTVTDTLTRAVRTYHNPAGQFASLADVEAFFDPILDPPPPTSPPNVVIPTPVVGCLPLTADPTSLCLGSGHFTVSVQFTDPRTGTTGPAKAVPLTSDTGAFWFFDDANLELMIKVLDGRAINGKFWVFYGALSDVDYTITVTRPETGEVKTYHNPRGTLASRADTQAF